MPAAPITTWIILQTLLPAGTQTATLDTPPTPFNGANFSMTNVLWPAGTVINALIEYSYDGGVTFPDSIGCPFTEGVTLPAIGLGAKQDVNGPVIPTHARMSIVINQSITTAVTGAWS